MPGERIQFQLVAGLGNPGPDYSRTRHNAGFWFVDELARQLGASFSLDKRYHAAIAQATVEGRRVHLVKPMNFMNNSGQGLAAVAKFYKIDPARILVAHDELDLEPGHIRVKNGGGHGGHNGLRDIVPRLGTKDFYRLRVGIGHPGHKNAVSGYVLKRPSADDQRAIEDAIDVALRESSALIDGDVNVATKAINGHRPISL